ncbi:unnamed protein product [Oppiella nova]|uniref:Uncharacterized protein n=1 Tax=Oppiella nova TaxID=334625 RepID=A0A7R9MSD5_9ACAR|nr:unnamed protein product [Oppiella nova]CAG2182724.1 unnamed protein product [Oppiella nova]
MDTSLVTDCMDNEEEYYHRLEQILVQNQSLRKQMQTSGKVTDNGNNIPLDPCHVWTLERIESLVANSATDCQQLIHTNTII